MEAIGIFDSGVGGLTVFREIRRALPNENLIYFGDTARVPYGGKSPETIISYSIQNTAFLMQHSIKALVIACNTAASHALDALEKFNLPLVDVIHPAAEIACQQTKTKHIAVIGTKATIRSGIYRKKIEAIIPYARVTEISCPLFVPLVEEDFVDHPATRMIVNEYLSPLKNTDVDVLVLGCTHYPFLHRVIQNELGNHIVILDSATACSNKLKHKLDQDKLLSKQQNAGFSRFFVSDDPARFRSFSEKFLGTELDHIELYQQ